VSHAYLVRDASGEEHCGVVVVTGPSESPDALGRRYIEATQPIAS
jgi:hypothetical protein